MGWHIHLSIISGCLLTELQAEEIYNNYIKTRSKSKKRRRLEKEKTLDLDPTLDFESQDFSIAVEVKKLSQQFEFKIYLLSTNDGNTGEKDWCLYYERKKLEMYEFPCLLTFKEDERFENFKAMLPTLNLCEFRLAVTKESLRKIFEEIVLCHVIVQYYVNVDNVEEHDVDDVESDQDEEGACESRGACCVTLTAGCFLMKSEG
jgi:hypothetical protein